MADSKAAAPQSSKRARGPEMSKTEEELRSNGLAIMNRENARNLGEIAFLRRWKQFFGISPKICAHIWDNHLEEPETLEVGAERKHLLWALLFLRKYLSESINCALVGCLDEGTFRRWSWVFVDEIAYLASKLVSCIYFACLQSNICFALCRLSGKTEKRMILETTASFLLMAPTFV